MRYKVDKGMQNALRIVAGKLPMVNEPTCEKHFVKGSELIELGTVDTVEGKKIIPDKMYEMTMPVFILVNHYRRLKKIYRKAGAVGVQRYVNQMAR